MLTTNKAVYGTDGSLSELGKLKGSGGGGGGESEQAETFSFRNVSAGVAINYKDISYYTYTCYRYYRDDELVVHHGIFFYDEGIEDEMGCFTDPRDAESLNAYYIPGDSDHVLIKDLVSCTRSYVIINGWR